MAIQVGGTTVIDNSRNITNIGIATITTLNVGAGGAYVSSSIGVGTTNPNAKLQVTPTSTGIAGLFSGTTSSDMVHITQKGTGNALVVEDSTSTPFVVTGVGSVGIGTTNPEAKLHVVGGSTVAGGEYNLIVTSSNSSTIPATITQGSSVGTLQVFSGGMASGGRKGGQIDFIGGNATTNAGSLIFRTGTASGGTSQPEVARFNASGNLGIGTTNPTQTLHIQGGARLTGALFDSTTPSGSAGFSGQILSSTGSGIQWIYANTTNVGSANSIGINADSTDASRYLTFVSTTSGNNLVYVNSNLLYNPSTSTLGINSTSFTGTASQPLQVTGGAYVSGNLGIGTTNPTSALDVRGNASISGLTTTNNLYVAGVGTFLSSGLKIRNPANTFGYTIAGDAIAADYTLTLPVVTANTGIAVTGLAQTFAATQTFSGEITHSSVTGNFTASSYTTGTFIVGGASQTGAITLGQATVSQTLGIATGVSGVGTTKTINFGTGGASGSFTQINIGPGPSAGVGTVVINSGTNLLVGTTTSTGTASQPLQVTGGAYVSGNLGIGTTRPTSALQVQGNTLITGIATFNSNLIVNGNTLVADATNNRVGILTTTPIQPFQVGFGTNIVVIDSSGNLGIGTTSPTRRIHLFGNASTNQFNAAMSIMNTNTTGYGAYYGLNATSITSGRDYRIISNGTLDTAGVGKFSIYDATAARDRLVIDSSGNTGIGTTNPVSTLQVKDALAFETTNTTTTSTTQVAIDSFGITTFRSAKYQVQMTCPGQLATLGGITTGGSGYTAGTFNVTFSNSSGTGAAAQGTLTISNGTVAQIGLGTTGGSGYIADDVLTAGGGSGLQVSVGSTDPTTGAILTLGAITSAGIGYTAGVGVGTTTLTFLGGTGTGAVGLATIFDGVITSSTLLQQPTTGTGGTTYYSGSNYTTATVLTIAKSDVTNTITDITGSPAGVSTLTSFTAHGIGVNDIIQFSANNTTTQLYSGTNYYVLTVPSTTTFTIGTAIGLSTYVGFNTTVSATGFLAPTSGIITGITTTSVSVGQYVAPISGVIGAGTTVTAVGIGSVFINPASLNAGNTSNTFNFGTYSFTSESIDFYRNSSIAGGSVAYLNAITGVSTNYQVSDLLVLQNGTTADYVEYGTIANDDILGTFAADISGANARLLVTPTYATNTVKVARQAITV